MVRCSETMPVFIVHWLLSLVLWNRPHLTMNMLQNAHFGGRERNHSVAVLALSRLGTFACLGISGGSDSKRKALQAGRYDNVDM